MALLKTGGTSSSPWWSIERVDFEWEVWIPEQQHETDINMLVDLASDMLVKMNGLAVFNREAGTLKLTRFVSYESNGKREVCTPLALVLRVTDLGGLVGPAWANIAFTKIKPEDEAALGELLTYWGQPNAETYEGLYKIYEWIEFRNPEIVKEVISDGDKDRLKHTCNHPSSGPGAKTCTHAGNAACKANASL